MSYVRPLETVDVNFMSDRFLGEWCCLYTYDEWFETKNGYNVKANYRKNDRDTITVINSYIQVGTFLHPKRLVVATGEATPVKDEPGHALVSFDPLRLFHGDYRIVFHTYDSSEKSMIVTGKNARRHAWILVRDPTMTPTKAFEFIQKNIEHFNLDKLRPVAIAHPEFLSIKPLVTEHDKNENNQLVI